MKASDQCNRCLHYQACGVWHSQEYLPADIQTGIASFCGSQNRKCSVPALIPTVVSETNANHAHSFSWKGALGSALFSWYDFVYAASRGARKTQRWVPMNQSWDFLLHFLFFFAGSVASAAVASGGLGPAEQLDHPAPQKQQQMHLQLCFGPSQPSFGLEFCESPSATHVMEPLREICSIHRSIPHSSQAASEANGWGTLVPPQRCVAVLSRPKIQPGVPKTFHLNFGVFLMGILIFHASTIFTPKNNRAVECPIYPTGMSMVLIKMDYNFCISRLISSPKKLLSQPTN